MNKVEFEQCIEAAAARVTAATDGEDMKVQRGVDQTAVFAGTGLPASAILGYLGEEAADKGPMLAEWPGWVVLKSVMLNGFLLGYECGKRAG